MNYKITDEYDFSLTPSISVINIGMSPKVYKQLTDEELSNYIADSLTHEHIHNALLKMFNITVTKLFDVVQQYFRDVKLHEKIINIHKLCYSSSGKITHQQFIKQYGISIFLSKYNITGGDMINAKIMCNNRM